MPGRGNAGSIGASLMKAGRLTCTGLIYELLVLPIVCTSVSRYPRPK